jgi:hypothetical protein
MDDENPINESGENVVLDSNQFKSFIGAKIIKARPMTHFDFLAMKGQEKPDHENQNGYLVEYQDNYISWSPKYVFENAYREILASEKDLIFT